MSQDSWKQSSVFEVKDLQFPYLYRFPGQEKSEHILFVTREVRKLLVIRLICIFALATIIIAILALVGKLITDLGWVASSNWSLIMALAVLIILLITGVSWKWMIYKWQRTVGILTTYRLVKIVQVAPWLSQAQTLPLKEIVDTSASVKNWWGAILGFSTFTARSSAASSGVATTDAEEGQMRINRKYFYLENIFNAQDLEHYVNKLLHVNMVNSPEKMATFRPFIPGLKGTKREKFMEEYPEYWS